MILYLQHALKEWYPGEIMKPCIQEFSKSPRTAHTITLKTNGRTNLDQNAEASASSSQLARAEEHVTSKSRTMLDQQKEREVKNEDEENDQASAGKPVTLLLDQKKEQEVKYEDGGDDQASTEKPVP